ncbi:MAG: hypothetical protein ACOVNY_00135 [Chitinophagaceae bacterium]
MQKAFTYLDATFTYLHKKTALVKGAVLNTYLSEKYYPPIE